MKDFESARNYYVRRFNKHAQPETRAIVEKEIEYIKKHQPEFLGIQFYLPDLGQSAKIWELQEIGKEHNLERLKVDYGDKNYYAIFDVESNMFIDDEPKSESFMLYVMFGLK